MEVERAGSPPLPQIARYDDYRKFLSDFFTYKKSLKKSFSYRRFSQLVGLKSPNYLQLVIQGKRNLMLATADTIAKALKLANDEQKYFVALVARAGATSQDDKRRAEKMVFRSARHLQTRYANHSQNQLFAKWYHVAVRELAQLKDFEPSGDYISKKLSGLITPEQAEESLKFLLAIGLLDSNYRASEPVFDTGTDIFQHAQMQAFHAQLLRVWVTHMDRLGGGEQELGVLNIPLPAEKIPELIKKIRAFQDEIIGWVQSLRDCDRLVQLGTYLMAFEDSTDPE